MALQQFRHIIVFVLGELEAPPQSAYSDAGNQSATNVQQKFVSTATDEYDIVYVSQGRDEGLLRMLSGLFYCKQWHMM